MNWVSWIAPGSQIVAFTCIAVNVWLIWRNVRLYRKLQIERAKVVAEAGSVTELHYALTWIFAHAALHDTLPWWRHWGHGMHRLLIPGAEEDAAASGARPVAETRPSA